jgi:hypothetical protein
MSPSLLLHDNHDRTTDQREQLREARRSLKQLPLELRRQIERARRPDLQHRLAQEVLDRVAAIARSRGAIRVRRAGIPIDANHEWIAPFAKRSILRELAADRQYVQHVHRRVDQTLRVAHLERLTPELPHHADIAEFVDEPGASNPRAFASDLGLRTATALDEAPDEFFVAAARTMHAAPDASDLWLEPTSAAVRCLVLDPRGGAMARAVAGLGLERIVGMQEVGAEFTATGLACVEASRQGEIEPGAYDYVVWAVPAPADPSAANHIQAYRSSPKEDLRWLEYRVGHDHVRVRAPSVLGPERWRLSVATVLIRVVLAALRPGGTAILRLPGAKRMNERPRRGRSGKNGYEVVPELLDPILASVESWGFELVEAVAAVDEEPVRQPFMSSARAPWTHLTLRKRGG